MNTNPYRLNAIVLLFCAFFIACSEWPRNVSANEHKIDYAEKDSQAIKQYVDSLVQSKAINKQDADEFGMLPLGWAALYDNQKLAEALLKNQANPNITDKKGMVPLHYVFLNAILESKLKPDQTKINQQKKSQVKLQLVKLLLNSGANVNAADETGFTPLMSAATAKMTSTEQSNAVILLLSSGANINAQDKNGTTALMYAVLDNKPALVKLLLENGANESIKDGEGYTALQLAEIRKLVKIVTLLRMPP